MKKVIGMLFFIVAFFGPAFFSAADASLPAGEPNLAVPLPGEQKQVNLYFFYGSTCPHCKKAEKFLANLQAEYPRLQIERFEVFGSKENAQLLSRFFKASNKGGQIRVPAIFIGKKVIIGYLNDETTGQKIAASVRECLQKPCPDPLSKINEPQQESEGEQVISLPFIGKVDLFKMSLPVLTITLGALDGFNPCAMWILIFLLALLVSTRSRKRMWLIGGTFIFASGFIYYLLLAAWLNLFLAISYVQMTRIVIGVLAIALGLWQIKSFFTFKPGVCKVTDGKTKLKDRMKDGLKSHAEKLALSPFTWALLGGVIVLAFSVNLLEFFCSAGLPAIYTQILTLNHLSSFTYYMYLLLYTFIFMLDDLIIFSLALITLSKFGFTEKYNYWSTLIGGLLILLLGLLLIFKPGFLMFN